MRATLAELSADETIGPLSVLSREDLSPRARLIELFATLDDGQAPLRGDPFAAAAYELADPAHPARRTVAEHAAGFVARLSDLARAAGARDPERVGRRLALLYAGAAAQMVALDSVQPIGDAMGGGLADPGRRDRLKAAGGRVGQNAPRSETDRYLSASDGDIRPHPGNRSVYTSAVTSGVPRRTCGTPRRENPRRARTFRSTKGSTSHEQHQRPLAASV